LTYLVDIFGKTNSNKSLCGPKINTQTQTQTDKVNAFMKKLELWKRNIEHNIFDISYF